MIQNNNLSVLPWYKDIRQQHHRKNYAYGAIYPLYTPANYLLPFQIIRDTRNTAITSVRIYDKDGNYVVDVTQYMRETGLQIVKFESLGYDVIIYPGNLPMATNMLDGQYYATMTDGVDIWYSEMFTIVQDVSGYLKIEWYDDENFVFDAGIIIYNEPRFKNCLYLCADIGKPDYQFEEEAETRNGYVFPLKQISNKTYKFTALAPEYLCDVMRFIRMSDYVVITDKYGRIYKCDTFLITPKWQTQGDLASIEIEFTTNTAAKKLGLAYLRPVGGDFNNDYNNDYNNQVG